MKPVSVLIVDDSVFIRKILEQLLSEDPGIHVLGSACDPIEAREKIKALNPDVLILDIEMPKMDGIEFLEKIMTLRPMPVIMFSSLTQKGALATVRALELGAFDAIGKPIKNQTPETIAQLKEDLISRIYAAATSRHTHKRPMRSTSQSQIVPFHIHPSKSDYIIAIGASTGGVEALRDVFLQLPSNVPPIVITQHMPSSFTTSFATRLNELSHVNVCEAENHQRLKPGHAYLAPGGFHMRVVRVGKDLVCKIEEGPTVSGHKPSVDVLFQSVAQAAGSRAVGVILTGMGRDGAQGLKDMRKVGAHTIGQNEATAIVYGMPRVAHEMGAVCIQVPLLDIPKEMLGFCQKGKDSA